MSTGVLRYEERESTTMRWIIIFVLLSLLAHILIIAIILAITHFLPPPKLHPVPPPNNTVKLTFIPPPPPTVPKKPPFVPTQPQANVPHKVQPIESANDTLLHTKSQVARNPDSIMPDVTGKAHNPDLQNTPQVQAPPKPEVSSTPPTPRQETPPQKPTPPQPNPQHAEQKPQPPQPKPTPAPPKPNPKPVQPVDPLTGLPVLPPINAQTMAPANQPSRPLAPAPSQRQQEDDIHGDIGMAGDNSPAAMATALGKYNQYVHDVVGSSWYPDIDAHFGTTGVGVVTIQFTISSDGSITSDKVTMDNNTEILKGISNHALTAPAPFKPFPPELIQELNGNSYTYEFSFSVY